MAKAIELFVSRWGNDGKITFEDFGKFLGAEG